MATTDESEKIGGHIYAGTFCRVGKDVSAAHTVGDDESVIRVDASAGDVPITLPAASDYRNREITIVKIDSSTNEVTCESTVFKTQYAGKTYHSDGTNWIPLP